MGASYNPASDSYSWTRGGTACADGWYSGTVRAGAFDTGEGKGFNDTAPTASGSKTPNYAKPILE